MEYITDKQEAARIDSISINEIGIPSMVLMEKAALKVVKCIEDIAGSLEDKVRILSVCGTGNNGGDGIAVARLLKEEGYNVSVYLTGNQGKCSEEMRQQKSIAANLDVRFCTEPSWNEYDIIIDAVFGIGLSREITGEYSKIIESVNTSKAVVVAVDIPSGICASTGRILGCAVKADYTVTFGTNKRGIILFPGAAYAGKVLVEDIGFPKKAEKMVKPAAYTYKKEDLELLIPDRRSRTNKGDYGKVLVIAGSDSMSGACFFTARASYRMGCGLVRILTSSKNTDILKIKLPEAIVGSYENGIDEALGWADVIVAGPGLGTDENTYKIMRSVLECKDKPVIIDADGLNTVAKYKERFSETSNYKYPFEIVDRKNIVITPHLKEMSRLTGKEVSEIKEDMVNTALLTENGSVVVLKDARTVVSDGKEIFINTAGNNALATGGSGDVLCGIIAGLVAQNMTIFEAAKLGVYIHALTAESYSARNNRYTMLASDIIEELQYILPY